MAQNAFGFPLPSTNEVSIDRAFGPPLQAAGNLTYLEFISVVKLLWENLHPDIPIVLFVKSLLATTTSLITTL